jgi:NAD(P)-dependent dehydrogenase (short-subunit alcohol dehydrogenase family)
VSSDRLSLAGRTALVTGAGQGLGRAEALALSAAGARVVVNDYDGDTAASVGKEIEAAGGEAVAAQGNVAEWATAESLVRTAVDAFGSLDVLVNNAGILRDRMIFNISEEEWDSVLAIHLKGHAAMTHFATAHWREQSKAAGAAVYARVVNTSSEAFLFGSGGQPNYAAAKSGIVALTVATAKSCSRYGVLANAICPRARTQMTAGVFGEAPAGQPDPLSPDHVAPLVAYLASPAAERITAQVFVVYGGMVVHVSPPAVAQRWDAAGGSWSADDLDATLGDYFAGRDMEQGYSADAFMTL